MGLAYDPKDAVSTMPAGEYEAVLTAVEDKMSKNNNPMQVLTWTVYTPDGKSRKINDYIVVPATLFKLKNLAKAVGRLKEFEAGAFQAEQVVDCNILVEVGIDSQPGYDDKNVIGKYKAIPVGAKPPREKAAVGEDIPFGWWWLAPMLAALFM